MAITPSTVTATFTLSATVDNNLFSDTETMSFSSISYMDKRTMSISNAAEINIMNFAGAGALGAAKFDESKTALIMIKNNDTTNFVRIRTIKTGADTVDQKLAAGRWTLVIFPGAFSVSAVGGAFAAFTAASGIYAQADTAAVQISYIVVQTT